jgi:hypothetical protein
VHVLGDYSRGGARSNVEPRISVNGEDRCGDLYGSEHRDEEVAVKSLRSKERGDMLLRDHDDVRHCSGSRVMEREDEFVLEDPVDHELAGQNFIAIPVGKSHAKSSRLVEGWRDLLGMDVIEKR